MSLWDYTTETRESVDTCILCESLNNYELVGQDRYGYEAPSRQCSHCGLVWLSPRMTRKGYARFYGNGAYRRLVSRYHGRPIDEETVQEDQRGYAAWLHDRVLGTVPWRRVLDVGGSTGTVGRSFGGGGTVVDPAPAELAKADGLHRIQSTVEDWSPEGRWDLILVCRSIDHFLNPLEAMRRLRSALAPSGRLWVDAVCWPRVAMKAGHVKGAMKIDHPYAFDEETLRRLVGMAGFDPVLAVHNGDHVGLVCV